ncbi:MAG: flavodoxin-dependent (E)-4-hydroxy-3-methylbut-2-enyl-diphosphate synthase [Dissulfurimicrobium sp.]|uniref:flavodoxin-dependent (E)-4-hydroxy-3-methylbut-2-enyl-diphosphate synthase n=1 Tax=Dissulfurimicrobium TaxID=1769732 RepID=UPI001EDAE31C|nr:flavodoxin-dependent (E)-4-hydroxy-3-methylbut-2-enyl-diphosphate synthase [Dissulfurimicrobium hydrothermale]UKL13732.1 flavodoxin-dependent (E)-4-hydroxy-3-methylbut-2-enyl-diphosphate synthase [Dissulfurimicrobium hydrothermale]
MDKISQNSIYKRRPTRLIRVGSVPIGGGNPVVVQSMTNTDTRDVRSTVSQISRLKEVGCEIVRVAIPDEAAAVALADIKKAISMPIIADIHFDWRLAVAAIEQGADGIRINPGNIGGVERLSKVVKKAKEYGVPIRIGINSGSLEKDIRRHYGASLPEALVESALRNIELIAGMGFEAIKVSIKSSDCLATIAAYRLLSQKTDFPLHLGVTEAGGLIPGTVKSSIAIGTLLIEGIGDTFRVSLTRDPLEEVRVAYEILRAVKMRQRGPEIISCPTCGRCEIDLFSIAEEVERRAQCITSPLKLAVMGCVVNGPGEAREADVGLAGGKGVGLIFKKEKIIKKVPESGLLEAFWQEVEAVLAEKRRNGEERI